MSPARSARGVGLRRNLPPRKRLDVSAATPLNSWTVLVTLETWDPPVRLRLLMTIDHALLDGQGETVTGVYWLRPRG